MHMRPSYRWFDVMSLALIAVFAGWQTALAEEITLRLKDGGGFQISGQLKEFDGKKYVIINPSFGKMEVNAERFECVNSACPAGPTPKYSSISSLFATNGVAKLTVSGSYTIGNQLMPDLIKAFADKLKLQATQIVYADPQIVEFKLTDSVGTEMARIIVNREASRTSFVDLKDGKAQIGMSSRPANVSEVTELREAGVADIRSPTSEHTIALDGLVILTSPENPVISMSIDNIAKVFSGEITNWGQLGYAPGQIKVYAPASDTGTWETFNALVLRPRGLTLTASAQTTNSLTEQSDWVAGDPFGIGVVGIAHQRSAKALNIQESCGLIIPPSSFSIKTEEYPLVRRLFLYTPGRPKLDLAAELVDFTLSDDAQNVVSNASFVNQRPEFISFADQGSRIAHALNAPQADFDLALMRELLTDVKGLRRLTFTFRFNIGSITLDGKSRQDAKKLSEMMLGNDLQGKSIKLLGFADSAGSFAANRALSLSRAEAVRNELINVSQNQLSPSWLIVKGYGELAPVACNNTAEGRAYNRRVEVWVD